MTHDTCSNVSTMRVTFIMDTVLVVMLTEIIWRWFSGGEWQQFAALVGLLITLGAVRVVAVRYRPVTGSGVQPPSQMSLSFP